MKKKKPKQLNPYMSYFGAYHFEHLGVTKRH